MTNSIQTHAGAQPQTEKLSTKKTFLGCGYFFLLFLYWILFKYLDPIGLENATKTASSQFFSAITEPFYGYGHSGYSQSRVAVVEISDATLNLEQETWPVSYRRQAYWLRHIIEARPAAVMVDIYFDGERQGDSLHAFDDVLAEAKVLGIPIFFVRGMATELAHDLPPVLAPYQVYSGWENKKENLYPLLVSAPQDKGKKSPTPAFAMYSALCEGAWKNICKAGEEFGEEFEEPLFVRWGVYADPLQKIAFEGENGKCQNSNASGLARLLRAVETGFFALSGKWKPPADNQCFYALTLDADKLDRLSSLTKQPYTDMLRGRAVFLGGDLQAIHDISMAPAIGQVPAVQLHAMAFDNLMTYGAHYFHESSMFWETSFFELDNAEALELGIWLILSLIIVRASLRGTQKTPKASNASENGGKASPIQADTHHPQAASSFFIRHRGSKTLVKYFLAAVLAMAGFVYDSFCRGFVSSTVLIFYVLLFLSMICMPVEFETKTYFMKLRQTLCVCSLVYCVNELFLHFPNADWLGLALLWFTVPEVNEKNGFVKTIEGLTSKSASLFKKHA